MSLGHLLDVSSITYTRILCFAVFQCSIPPQYYLLFTLKKYNSNPVQYSSYQKKEVQGKLYIIISNLKNPLYSTTCYVHIGYW